MEITDLEINDNVAKDESDGENIDMEIIEEVRKINEGMEEETKKDESVTEIDNKNEDCDEQEDNKTVETDEIKIDFETV